MKTPTFWRRIPVYFRVLLITALCVGLYLAGYELLNSHYTPGVILGCLALATIPYVAIRTLISITKELQS